MIELIHAIINTTARINAAQTNMSFAQLPHMSSDTHPPPMNTNKLQRARKAASLPQAREALAKLTAPHSGYRNSAEELVMNMLNQQHYDPAKIESLLKGQEQSSKRREHQVKDNRHCWSCGHESGHQAESIQDRLARWHQEASRQSESWLGRAWLRLQGLRPKVLHVRPLSPKPSLKPMAHKALAKAKGLGLAALSPGQRHWLMGLGLGLGAMIATVVVALLLMG